MTDPRVPGLADYTGHYGTPPSRAVSNGNRAQLRKDLERFADHPDDPAFVRRVVDDEFSAEDYRMVAGLSDAEWVLVRPLNETMTARIRTPLTAGSRSISDHEAADHRPG